MKTPYFDCNATTPIEPEVANIVRHFMDNEYGNPGSRSHDWGTHANQAVELARSNVAAVTADKSEAVVFTSGATESNNLAILGLAEHGEKIGHRHIISTQIEHKAVLEPLEHLRSKGFDVTLVPTTEDGFVKAEDIAAELREDTLLVSIMHANNETGIIQPISEIADILADHSAYFHVDAAQTFGKLSEPLRNVRIDLISCSAHKVYGPKGVGALISRRRKFKRPPLSPLMFGGGQEKGLRPGTMPAPLIAGFGKAAELALKNCELRRTRCLEARKNVQKTVEILGGQTNGTQEKCLTHVINFSVPGVNSEAAMVALKGLVAVSNGSACTSANYKPSHVLLAMGLPESKTAEALRFSWCHMTPEVDWDAVVDRIQALR